MRLGRRCERYAQNVVLEKQSVRPDGSCFRLETWVVDSLEENSCVSRISLYLVSVSSLVERAIAVCDTARLLFWQGMVTSLEVRGI